MKKIGFILSFFVLTMFVNAQVKQNENGLYANINGTLYTGILETMENGIKKSEMEIEDGLPNGKVSYYYASGKVMESGFYDRGQKHGKWLRFNEAGIEVGLAIYHLGKKNGTWIVWDDAGKKRFEMHYHMNEKTGVWNSWDEKGELVSTQDYSQVN